MTRATSVGMLGFLAACSSPQAAGTARVTPATASIEGRARIAVSTMDFATDTLRATKAGGEIVLLAESRDGVASLHFPDGAQVAGPSMERDLTSIPGGASDPAVVMAWVGDGYAAWHASRDGFERIEAWPRDVWNREGVVFDGQAWTSVDESLVRVDLATGRVDPYPGFVPDVLRNWAPSAELGLFVQPVGPHLHWYDPEANSWNRTDIPAGYKVYQGVVVAPHHYVAHVTREGDDGARRLARIDLNTGVMDLDPAQWNDGYLLATDDGAVRVTFYDDGEEAGIHIATVRF